MPRHNNLAPAEFLSSNEQACILQPISKLPPITEPIACRLTSLMAMSVMSTITSDFTVRDLSRNPTKVLEACDRMGFIRIRNHKGTTYELCPEPTPASTSKPDYPDFAARRRALKMPMMTAEQREKLDKLIAGE